MPPVINYSDNEVVAAFNSCLDLEKYKKLPQGIKTRICTLLQRHRIKPVCFMERVGLGLRVYNDNKNLQLTYDLRGGDECELLNVVGETRRFEIDDEGSWMQCPAKLYTEKQVKSPDEWLILDDIGQNYLELEGLVDDDSEQDTYEPEWTTLRGGALSYRDRTRAELVAKAIKGVVVKKNK